MTGGLAFVYDPQKAFVDKMNQELIEAVRIDTDDTERERLYLKRLLMDYENETESERTQFILENYRAEIRNFWLVKPKNMTVLPLDPDKGD
jgi:glutamate synthase (NADPH/NADH) large chain